MNRSVYGVMVGVAGLAVLGKTATLAGVQTGAVPEAAVPEKKTPLDRYESYCAFPLAHWADVDKDNATGNQKILAPLARRRYPRRQIRHNLQSYSCKSIGGIA
jgi:hypothetical protein